MAAKIFTLKHAIFHADTLEEMQKIFDHSVRGIEEKGGGVVEFDAAMMVKDGPNAGTFVQNLGYYALEQFFETEELKEIDDHQDGTSIGATASS